jgi:DNA polymerase-3 subunit gamma/tau
MLSTASFNALLKTLEEPPAHVKFVLATTDPEKIPVTILSRCLRFSLRRLLPEQISGYLDSILAEEGIPAESAAVERIARAADGSMRDALSLLDQAIAYGAGELRDDDVAQMTGAIDHAYIVRLVEAVAAADADALMAVVDELVAQSRDLEKVLAAMAEVLHRMGLVQIAPGYRDPSRSDWPSIEALAGEVSAEDVQLYYEIAVHGRRDLGLAPDPRTGLEMALLRMLAFRPAQAAGSASAAGSKPKVAAKPPVKAAKSAAVSAASAAINVTTPASAPAPAAARKTSAPAGDDEWQALLGQLKLSGPVRELARNITLESRAGETWRFLIPESVSHLGSAAVLDGLRNELSSQLGQPVNLALHTAGEPLVTAASISQNAELKRRSEAELAIDSDPTVRSLKERFGARVLEDSIQPLQ